MKYNQLSHIIFPGKQVTSRPSMILSNSTIGMKVFKLPIGTVYLLVLHLIETLNKIYYLFNAAELDAGLCSVQTNALQINVCNHSTQCKICTKSEW